MAQKPRYHISQVDPIVQKFGKEEPASVFYLAQTYNLGICIGELIGIGLSPDDLRKAIDVLIDTAVKTRAPAPIPGQG